MSDLMVLAERYAAFTIRAERLQAAMDAIAKAEPDVEMYAMIDSLKVRRDKELTDRASIQLEMMKLLDEMRGGTPSRESLGGPRMMTSKTASRISGPSKVIIPKGEPKPIDGGNRMCGYEICPMMNGDKWPDCSKCPYADGTEGGERMRTHYLYDIERILGTFEAIKEHEGKNATGIAKGVGYPAVIGRINEFMAKGLVKTYSLHRDIYLTPKG